MLCLLLPDPCYFCAHARVVTSHLYPRHGVLCFLLLVAGLVLLEMSTGAPIMAGCFAQEAADQFCERSFPPCACPADSEALLALRGLLGDIFGTQRRQGQQGQEAASVLSLLAAPFFASVTLPVPSTRLKLNSVEKGLVKSAMKV